MSPQTTSPLFSVGDASIKYESFLDDVSRQKLTFMGISPILTPHSMKAVEVLCLNKVYRGFGFRNVNGGLEFFSMDAKKQMDMHIQSRLDCLRHQLSEMTSELSHLTKEVSKEFPQKTQYERSLHSLKDRHSAIVVTLEDNVIKTRQGEMTEEDKNLQRKSLRFEMQQINKDIADLEYKLSSLDFKTNRMVVLKCIIHQLEQEIEDLEHHLSILGTVTIDQPGILFFPYKKGVKSKACCLFMNMFDYLSYVCLICCIEGQHIPSGCDSLVMNDPRNFFSLMISSDDYDKIYVFFPNTMLGSTLSQTIIQRNPDRAISAAHYYEKFVDIHELAKSLTDEEDLFT